MLSVIRFKDGTVSIRKLPQGTFLFDQQDVEYIKHSLEILETMPNELVMLRDGKVFYASSNLRH